MHDLISELISITDASNVLLGDDVRMRSTEWGKHKPCEAAAIVRPASTQQLAQIMRLCHENHQKVVVHGGLTGLVGGADANDSTVIVSLERMNAIEEIDCENRTAIVGAGATLQAVQEAADDKGLFFAVDLGARGSATIGGAIATNAGGNNVIRFGMMREQVLGLEAVLPNGEIISSMSTMIKNNAGYDLKQLFIGSEGTLGIVTKAVLRLRFSAEDVNTALVALPNFNAAIKTLHLLEQKLAGRINAFELMWPKFYERVTVEKDQRSLPLRRDYNLYALVESLATTNGSDAEVFMASLEGLIEGGLIEDATVAVSGKDRNEFWALRENIEALFSGGPTAAFDVSMKIQDIPEYLYDVHMNIINKVSNAIIMPFGHLGDNNLHLAVNIPDGNPSQLIDVKKAVYEPFNKIQGSISAEHGIGVEKKPFLYLSRSDSEIAIMKKLKDMFDPHRILNIGVVL